MTVFNPFVSPQASLPGPGGGFQILVAGFRTNVVRTESIKHLR